MKIVCFSVLFVFTTQFSTTGLIAQESPLGKTYKDNLVQSIELLVRDNYVLRQKRNAAPTSRWCENPRKPPANCKAMASTNPAFECFVRSHTGSRRANFCRPRRV